MPDNQSPIVKVIAQLEQNFEESVKVSENNYFNQKHLVKIIDLYTHSKLADSNDPSIVFYNVINQALNVADRKTDIDFRDIRLYNNDDALKYLLNAAHVEFADDHQLPEVLNDMVESYDKYGTVVLKAIKRGTKTNILYVVPFSSFLCDQNNFESAPQMEQHATTLQFLKQNDMYDQDTVNALEAAIMERSQNYQPDMYKVDVKEVHGYLPASYVEEGEEGMRQQMHVVAEWGGQKWMLFSGYEKESPYMFTVRKKIPNRSMGMGVAEEMVQAQIVANETANLMIEQLRATAKIIYQSSDAELDGLALQEVDNLSVIAHEEGGAITQVSTNPTSFVALQSYMRQWINQSKEQSSANDITLGKNLTSGTPFASAELLSNEADGTFDYHREKLEIFLRAVYKQKLISMLIAYFNSKTAITDLLSGTQLRDFYYFVAEKLANKRIIDGLLESIQTLTPTQDPSVLAREIYREIKGQTLSVMMDERVTPDRIIDKTRVYLTPESDVIQQELDNLNRLYQIVAQNPEAHPTRDLEDLMDQILELSSIATLAKVKVRNILPVIRKSNTVQESQVPEDRQIPTSPQGLNASLQSPLQSG